MPDPSDITEVDLEALAREQGKPMPDHLKNRVLDEISRKRTSEREAELLRDITSNSNDSPELEP